MDVLDGVKEFFRSIHDITKNHGYELFILVQPNDNSKNKYWTASDPLKNLFGNLVSPKAKFVDVSDRLGDLVVMVVTSIFITHLFNPQTLIRAHLP